MSLSRYPFNDSEHAHLFAKISRGHFHVPECLSSKARCVIRALLRRHPEERITSEDLLHHPWLTKENFRESVRSCSDQTVPMCAPVKLRRSEEERDEQEVDQEMDESQMDQEQIENDREVDEVVAAAEAAAVERLERSGNVADEVPVLSSSLLLTSRFNNDLIMGTSGGDGGPSAASFMNWLRG